MEVDEVRLFSVRCDFEAGLSDESYELALYSVDAASRERAGRFFHRADAWRFLAGRLLRAAAIDEVYREAQPHSAPPPLLFETTLSGKPVLVAPSSAWPVGFNISHDSNVVLLAVRIHRDALIARDIGIDVMRIAIPEGETLDSFLDSISIMLTSQEMASIRKLASQSGSGLAEATTAIFKLWTIKESYVKALGDGLGFDMSRLEYDFDRASISSDGVPLDDWRFRSLFPFQASEREIHRYIGAICYRLPQSPQGSGGSVSEETFTTQSIDVSTLIKLNKPV